MQLWKRARARRLKVPRRTRHNVGRHTFLALALSCVLGSMGCTDDELVDRGRDPILTPSPTCGQAPRLLGSQERQIRSAGRVRTFSTYVPARLDPRRPAPLVFIFHGAAMTAARMRDLTGFEQLAEEKGFVAVFPDGDPALTWSIRPQGTQVCGIGELFTNPQSDDFQFVDDIIRDIESSQCLDRSHIFATGFSMGGYFSNRLACERPDLVRAVAAHSSGSYPGPCKGRVPMLMLHGTLDFVIGESCRNEGRARWVRQNGCSSQFETEQVAQGRCQRHRGCPADAGVTFCLFDGLCHGWSGRGTGDLFCLADAGSGPPFEDATGLIWRFFEEHW